jgi:hypothetical protein
VNDPAGAIRRVPGGMLARSPGRASRGRRRRTSAGLCAAALATAILVGISPIVEASTHVVLTAPYRHSTVAFNPTKTTSGLCPTAASTSHTMWNASSGAVGSAASASVHSCAAPPIGVYTAYASASTDVEVAFPIKLATGGHNLSVSVSYNLIVTAATKGKLACPLPKLIPGQATSRSCFLQIAATTSWSMALWDSTNGSTLSGANGSIQGPTVDYDVTNTTTCNVSGVCSGSSSVTNCTTYSLPHCVVSGKLASGADIGWINTSRNCVFSYANHCWSWNGWTLNATHRYWLIVSFLAYTWVDLYHYPKGGSLVASVDAWGGGSRGWSVNTISVT